MTVVCEGFEWDSEKEKANVKKRGISFSEAVEVFLDDFKIEIEDEEHSDFEPREIVIGMLQRRPVVVFLVHTPREARRRIISARNASREETKIYAERLERIFYGKTGGNYGTP